jgi:hypothetical protein
MANVSSHRAAICDLHGSRPVCSMTEAKRPPVNGATQHLRDDLHSPALAPATTRRSSANALHDAGASQWKVAMRTPARGEQLSVGDPALIQLREP